MKTYKQHIKIYEKLYVIKYQKGGFVIKQLAQQKFEEVNRILKQIDKELEHMPEGHLKIQKRLENVYYYQMIQEKGKTKKYYIEKRNAELIKKLACKHYYMKVQTKLKKEREALKKFLINYDEKIADAIYDQMPVEKKELIQPLRMTAGEALRKWENERYEANQNYPENLIYKTDQGEMVRSKSELILANMLYQNRKYLLYKYERPLELMQGDKIQVIYPDFTILNIRTGKIIYWEHAGRMDDPKYANQFVYKINSYMSNGIMPGRDLIFTYETMSNPLNMQNALKLIESLR